MWLFLLGDYYLFEKLLVSHSYPILIIFKTDLFYKKGRKDPLQVRVNLVEMATKE